MTTLLLCLTLICVACNVLAQSHVHKELISAFRGGYMMSSELHAAVIHEENIFKPENSFSLACVPYRQSEVLASSIEQFSSVDDYHRVFHSVKEDSSCFIVTGQCGLQLKSLKLASVTIVPHVLKYDSSINECVDKILAAGGSGSELMTLEISVGLGVGGKGTSLAKLSSFVKSLFHETIRTSKDLDLLSTHWGRFYWTRADNKSRNLRDTSTHNTVTDRSHNFDKLRDFHSTAPECPYSLLQVEISKSHVSLVAPADFNPECMRFLATVATLRRDVTFVQATLGATFAAPTSEDYTEGDPATDQNAWVQSGTSTSTPYSDIGVDGTGYVLGMIDSGLDDLSCFLIDWSGNQTTRTPGYDYDDPITEPWRRKVIQYIMWGDGGPSVSGQTMPQLHCASQDIISIGSVNFSFITIILSHIIVLPVATDVFY
jgi:hypothetical protein